MVSYQKELPLYKESEIVVAGGGPSGVAAGAAASVCVEEGIPAKDAPIEKIRAYIPK